jgi:hypothetical protein
MVARITIPASLSATLNYNEKKVQKGVAECINASNFLLNVDQMNFYHKLNTFENRNKLNERATTKTIHVSLNFDPSERLSDDTLKSIADRYMEKMGFGDQPFLVYRHDDAGHPHIHIVSTLIREDGTRINTHRIGQNQSENARKEIEQTFGLVKAEKQNLKTREIIKPVDLQNISYGKTETKNAIAAVLTDVVKSYNYTSLPELNAALRQFHVMADRGKIDGFIYKNRGLLYSLIDAEGNKIGIPIKASRFYNKPGLEYLEKRFAENSIQREPFKRKLKEKLENALSANPRSIQELTTNLRKENVFTVLRQNEEGRLYGITFVDNHNRSVMNGSELGKSYSIAALLKRLTQTENFGQTDTKEANQPAHEITSDLNISIQLDDLFQELLSPVENFENTPYHLKKKKRKKKKKY